MKDSSAQRRWTLPTLVFLLLMVVAALGALTRAVGPPPAMAEPHSRPAGQEMWITYANGDGVLSLAVEEDTLWVGTEGGGLVQWDITARTFQQHLSPQSGLPSNDVRAVVVDDDGNKWLASSRGVAVRSPTGTITALYDTTNSPLPSNDVTSLAIAGDGDVWMGTSSDGVAVLSPSGEWIVYDKDTSGLASNLVSDVAFDSAGRAWIGTRRYENPTPPPGYLGGGVSIFDGQGWVTYDSVNSCLGSNAVSALARATGNEMWVGTWAGGIARLEYDGELRNCTAWQAQLTPGLDGNYIHDIAVDSRGQTWAVVAGLGGHEGQGVAVYDGRGWTAYNASNSQIISSHMRAVAADDNGRVWFGGPRGISVLDDSTWKAYVTAPRGLASNQITDIAFGPDGQIWFATADSGVSVLDDGTWTTYTRSNTSGGLISDLAESIAVDRMGRVWIGTQAFYDPRTGRWTGGVSMFDPNTGDWTAYPLNSVQVVAVDDAGRVWIGTGTSRERPVDFLGYGLMVFDGESWITYTHQNTWGGLSSDRISDIAFDSQGRVWVTTQPYVWGEDQDLTGGGVSVLDLGDNGIPDAPGMGDDVWMNYLNVTSCLVAANKDGEFFAVALDSRDQAWIAAWDYDEVHDWPGRQGVHAIVNQFDGTDCVVHTLEEAGYASSIAIDDEDGVWVGSRWGGVWHLSSEGWQNYSTLNSPLVSDEIWTVSAAPDGSLWFGSADAGVSHLAILTPTSMLYLPLLLQ